MRIKLIRMRKSGVEVDRRTLKELYANPGTLIVMDVTDQGLRRPVKVARVLDGDVTRFELNDVHVVWISDGRMTLSGFERQRNDAGELVDYAQSWLCMLDSPSQFEKM